MLGTGKSNGSLTLITLTGPLGYADSTTLKIISPTPRRKLRTGDKILHFRLMFNTYIGSIQALCYVMQLANLVTV